MLDYMNYPGGALPGSAVGAPGGGVADYGGVASIYFGGYTGIGQSGTDAAPTQTQGGGGSGGGTEGGGGGTSEPPPAEPTPVTINVNPQDEATKSITNKSYNMNSNMYGGIKYFL